MRCGGRHNPSAISIIFNGAHLYHLKIELFMNNLYEYR